TEEEQAKNFQRPEFLSHTIYSYTTQIILGRRVVIGISRPLNRVVTGTTIIITTVMDQTGEVVVTTITATTTTLATKTDSQQSRGPSEGYSYPVCTTCGRRHPGEYRRAAGTEEEQAKNFQWGLRRSTLNHLMCMSYTDVAQVANAARNYEILHDRDDDDAEQKSGDRHQPTTQQSSHRNHDHNNDRHGSDRRGGDDNHRSSNNYSSNNNRNFGNGRDQRNRGFQQSRGPSEGYSYLVCTTCGRRHPGECRRATGTCFKCGQAGHLQKDCKKNTTASTSGQNDKKPGASGRVFAITEDHATKNSV
nr:hypothetical protein [Tanacetum cinerariifolium]